MTKLEREEINVNYNVKGNFFLPSQNFLGISFGNYMGRQFFPRRSILKNLPSNFHVLDS